MVATGIFILLLLTLLSMRLKRRWPAILLFSISLICIVMLLSHHANDTLNVCF